jgi:hypothetical protein
MNEVYGYDKKKKLADRISKLKNKEDMVKIVEIIKKDNVNITENANGVFMFFNKLDNNTYYKIEAYLKSCRISNNSTNTFSDINTSEKSCTEENIQEDESVIKYSNREKNLIKRKRYNDLINNEHNSENGILYTKFGGDENQ